MDDLITLLREAEAALAAGCPVTAREILQEALRKSVPQEDSAQLELTPIQNLSGVVEAAPRNPLEDARLQTGSATETRERLVLPDTAAKTGLLPETRGTAPSGSSAPPTQTLLHNLPIPVLVDHHESPLGQGRPRDVLARESTTNAERQPGAECSNSRGGQTLSDDEQPWPLGGKLSAELGYGG